MAASVSAVDHSVGTPNARTSAGAGACPLEEEQMVRRFSALGLAACLVVAVGCAQTDAGVTTAVKSKLAADETVKAYEIDVDTANGVVTLNGTVETAAAKQQAVMIARQTDGVRDVVDNITVGPEAEATTGDVTDDARETGREIRDEAREGADATADAAREGRDRAADTADRAGDVASDAAITAGVKSKFLADTDVSGLKIDVDTNGSVVTLTGTVSTRAEADRAVRLARETDGVTRVVDNLRVGR
jgi:osmotically-inducible protein OsmY